MDNSKEKLWQDFTLIAGEALNAQGCEIKINQLN
jgi:hypothetical protein